MKNKYEIRGETLVVFAGFKGQLKEYLFDVKDFDFLSGLGFKLIPSSRGYLTIRPTIEGKQKTVLIHRLLTKAPEGLVVDHKDGNIRNNQRSNLELVSQFENVQRGKNGKDSIGVRHIGKVVQGKHEYFRVEIRRNGKLFSSRFKEFEDAVSFRDNTLRELGEL